MRVLLLNHDFRFRACDILHGGRYILHGGRDILHGGRYILHGGRDILHGGRYIRHGGRDILHGDRNIWHRGNHFRPRRRHFLARIYGFGYGL